jgi:protein-S-isoprenylcysteine O-methyltransferase Ste14
MMNNTLDDRPDVIVFPPLILIATILLAALLQWTIPLGAFATIDRSLRITIGGMLTAIGAALTIAGARALIRHGTNVNPLRPALTLATNGIYRWTRNPMYDGGTPMMFGLALMFACDWLPLLMVPSYLVLYFGVIRREERYLERKFGAPYRRYCAQVPRHLLPR